jgi:hypothetical protein
VSEIPTFMASSFLAGSGFDQTRGSGSKPRIDCGCGPGKSGTSVDRWLLVPLLSPLAADVSAAAVKGRRRSHCGNSSTGFIAAPEMASAAARLMSAKS